MKSGRETKQLVDGNGLYFSRVVRAGPFVFLGSVAVDERGAFPLEARPEEPYHLSQSAIVRAQTNFVFRKYKAGLQELGSSIDEIVQVEQHIPLKAFADGYLEASRAPEFMKAKRPGSALIETGDLLPSECVINPSAIAVVPSGAFRKEIANPGVLLPSKDEKFGPSYAQEPAYNELVRAGNYFFTVGDVAVDFISGIHPKARVVDWVWWGNEARGETDFILKVMETRMKAIGASMEDLVHVSVFLPNLSDLYEVDLVWKKHFPQGPPARFVTPVRGLGIPRKEGARGHAEGAANIETMFRGIIPGSDVKKEIINTDRKPLGHESVAVRAGPLLWISGLVAEEVSSREFTNTESEAKNVLEELDAICAKAGTKLQNTVRLAASVTSVEAGYDFFRALKSLVPEAPPTVVLNVVQGPLQKPGRALLVGGTAYIPE